MKTSYNNLEFGEKFTDRQIDRQQDEKTNNGTKKKRTLELLECIDLRR